jgi:hypothetical protein
MTTHLRLIGLSVGGLLLLASAAAAQDEPRINVYVCDVECSHTVTSQEFTADEWELVLGEPPPSPTSHIVCLEAGGCGWSDVPIEEVEIVTGGDGIVEPIEFIPPLPPPPDTAPSAPADPATVIDDATLDNREFRVVNCRGDRCTVGRRTVSAHEATIIMGDPPPPGPHHIRCDAGGCRWVRGDGTIQPRDGRWEGDAGVQLANNCVNDAALEAIQNIAGSGVKTWSRPPRITNFWEGAFTGWDRVTTATPAPNTYRLTLQQGFDQFRAIVTYEWVILSETFIAASVELDLPSIPSGRCRVYISVTMQHQG